eukprot:GILI01020570.1.p1 GENE.GILI01020570.1~~GILI01020570.1.p1  ORF type:complete len:166 (-),score=31.74 GILI01020570.1:54-551(-)
MTELQAVAEEVVKFDNEPMTAEFHHLRYYVGHVTKFGTEFLEFELRADGMLRYANQSNYRKDPIIKKQTRVSPAVIEEVKRLVVSSQVLTCDDSKWPEPDRDGKQELDVRIGNTHVSFSTNKISQDRAIKESADPEGLAAFTYLVQEIKDLTLTLLSLHFKLKPV